MKTPVLILLLVFCCITAIYKVSGQSVYPTASAVTTSFSCLNCSVTNASQALNNNPSDYASIQVGMSLASTISLDLTFSPAISAGNIVSVVVEDPTSLLDVLGGVSYSIWNGNTYVSTSSWNVMPYNGSSTQKLIYATASGSFTTLRISVVGFLSFAKSLRVYSAAAANGYVPLPVTFLDFTATTSEQVVNLSWLTTYEKDNRAFEVLRSADAEQWNPISTIKGKENSSEMTAYEYTDPNPLKGLNYYRIRQTDNDGTESYSKMICIRFGSKPSDGIRLFPNPVSGSSVVSIELGEEQAGQEQIWIDISNMQGRSFGSQMVKLDGMQRTVSISSGLSKGIYLVRIQTVHSVKQERLVIE